GCAAKSSVDTEDVREAFLTVYGTYNYDGRYEAFNESMESLEKMTADDAEKTLRRLFSAQQDYYASLSDYVSPKFYERMVANNDPFKYEELAYEKGLSYRTDGFEFEEYSKTGDKTTYSFVAHFVLTDSEGVEQRGSIKGQITVQEADGKKLVSNLYLSPVGFAWDGE
nr:hypothetical protein [Clostridia bacterium]